MQKYRAFVQMVLASNWSLQIHWANPTIRGKYSESRTSQSFSHPSAPTDSATGGNLAWVTEEGWNGLNRAQKGPEVQPKMQANHERVWKGLGKNIHWKNRESPSCRGFRDLKAKARKAKSIISSPAWLQKAKYTVCSMKLRESLCVFYEYCMCFYVLNGHTCRNISV